MHNLSAAHYHQPPPKAAEISEGLEQPFEVEELRFSVGSMKVIDRSFGETESGILKTLYHLDADRSAGRAYANAGVSRPAHQSEITIDVSDLYSKRESHEPAINSSDDDSMKRVRAADLVTVHDIHIIGHQRSKLLQLTNVVLRIPISVEDPVLDRAVESRPQRAAISSIRRMMDNAKLRINGLQFGQDKRGVIAAAIVYHYDFIIIGELSERSVRKHDHAGDCARVIVCGKEDAYSGFVRHLLLATGGSAIRRPTGLVSSPI